MTDLTPLAAAYDVVLLDLDGCVYVGEEALPGAVEAVAALRAAGKGVAFVTNDGRRSGEEYVRKLWALGLQAALEEVVTVGGAIQHVLAQTDRWRSAYVVGAPVLHRHVLDAGLKVVNGLEVPAPDVVVVGAHDAFGYDELRGAVQAVLGGAELVCAGRDATFPMPDGPWPGSGAVVAAVEAATGVPATNLGKPAAQPFLTALDRLGITVTAPDAVPPPAPAPSPPSAAERLAARGRQAAGRRAAAEPESPQDAEPTPDPDAPQRPPWPGETDLRAPREPRPAPPAAPPAEDPARPRVLVVGDRLDSDLAGAHAAGLDGAIVLTGATSAEAARAATDPAPVAVAASLAALVLADA